MHCHTLALPLSVSLSHIRTHSPFSLSLQNTHSPGLTFTCAQSDPTLTHYGRDLVSEAARQLHAAKMAVFEERSSNMFVTELGRVASHFYIR